MHICKKVLALCLIACSLFEMATAEQLKVDNSIRLKSFNHRMSVRLQHRQKLRKLAKIRPKEAERIAKEACGAEKIRSNKLMHKGQLLYYRIDTGRCLVKINALDGVVISKTLNRDSDKEGKIR